MAVFFCRCSTPIKTDASGSALALARHRRQIQGALTRKVATCSVRRATNVSAERFRLDGRCQAIVCFGRQRGGNDAAFSLVSCWGKRVRISLRSAGLPEGHIEAPADTPCCRHRTTASPSFDADLCLSVSELSPCLCNCHRCKLSDGRYRRQVDGCIVGAHSRVEKQLQVVVEVGTETALEAASPISLHWRFGVAHCTGHAVDARERRGWHTRRRRDPRISVAPPGMVR